MSCEWPISRSSPSRGAGAVQRELLGLLKEIEFVGVPALSASPSVRRAIADAWFSRAPLRVHYRRKEGSLSIRRVTIERVSMERTMTLLNLVDTQTGERRQYQLHHIERATP